MDLFLRFTLETSKLYMHKMTSFHCFQSSHPAWLLYHSQRDERDQMNFVDFEAYDFIRGYGI